MKKAKFLIPLIALFCLCIPLSACKKDDSGKNPELEEHFAISEETKSYSTVDDFEGDIVDVDTENNFIALKTTEYTTQNNIQETIKVIDMETGKVIHVESITNSINTNPSDRYTIDVEFDYPCFRVINRSYYNSEYHYSYTYYFLQTQEGYAYSTTPQAVRIGYDNSGVFNSVKKGSLYMIETGESTLWVNEQFEIIREFKKGQTVGYANPVIQTGFGNYLYAWDLGNSNAIQVYNAEGVCCMQYTYPSNVNAILSGPFVLNNGNILVQEATLLDASATEYTLKYPTPMGDMKYNMQTKVIDYKTGNATVVDCDFLVVDVASAYAGKGDFPFALASGQQNQAYVSKIVNGYVTSVEYVVLDNEASIVYSFPNEKLANASSTNSYRSITILTEKYYGAMVIENGVGKACLFDMFGNLVMDLPQSVINGGTDCGVCDGYYVTPYGIYDFEQNLLYDLEACEMLYNKDVAKTARIFVDGGEAFIEETDKVNDVITLYKFNAESKTFEKFGDSNSEMRLPNSSSLPMGNYVTVYNSYDNSARSYTWTLYNSDGDAFVRVQVKDIHNVLNYCNGLAYIETEINGNPYVYIIK